jgi:hypothetical protein
MTSNSTPALLLRQTQPEWDCQDLAEPEPACPPWCIRASEAGAPTHLAHRGRIWELSDRVELCVMQVISGDLPPGLWDRPSLYFWVADDEVFTEAERAQVASALHSATDLLCSLYCG